MSVFPLTSDDIEIFTVQTHPYREFSSASNGITTGSVFVFPIRSKCEKFLDGGPVGSTVFNEQYLETQLAAVKQAQLTKSGSLAYNLFDQYLNSVNQYPEAQKYLTELFVDRFVPTVTFSTQSIMKTLIRETLLPFHRFVFPTAHYAYTNYHSLNFLSGSSVPGSTAIIYPNVADPLKNYAGFVSGCYVLTGGFSFEFYVNPRYRNPIGTDFHAGTIFHMSSSYAVSLVSGSKVDMNGQADGFRLQLQLSQSANIAPSKILPGPFPSDLCFLSDDNCLEYNRWHHVVVRWGGNKINEGTGSFVVDGLQRGSFVIPSASIALKPFAAKYQEQPAALVIGNFYEGPNGGTVTGYQQDLFFSECISQRDGIQQMNFDPVVAEAYEPGAYHLSHSLNAELHELRIWNRYLTLDEIVTGSGQGCVTPLDKDLLFYVPPFFTKQAPFTRLRPPLGQPPQGGIMRDLSTMIDGETATPFNPYLSFDTGARLINIENFTRDFVTGRYPRQLGLVVFPLTESLNPLKAANNDLNDERPEWRKRNLTILPCDDGNFIPNFQILATGSSPAIPDQYGINSMYVNDFGLLDYSLINIGNVLPPIIPTLGSANLFVSSSVSKVPAINHLPSVSGLFDLTTFQKVRSSDLTTTNVLQSYEANLDPSSSEIIIFNVSNLFYGNRILPGTLMLTDSNISGSGGSLSITLRDNGYGNLYRADCVTSQSMWNSVGNVLYDEGLILIKSPHVGLFGQDQFTISFQGEQNIHTMKIDVLVPGASLNSSSNPSYIQVSASLNVNEDDQKFVYLTGMNFHDRDFNVVMRTNFAQPFIKRTGDKILVRTKFDW